MLKKKMRAILGFSVSVCLFFLSCSNNDDTTNTEIPAGTNFRVNYFTTNCTGLFEQTCLLVQEGNDLGTEKWDYFYSEIEGFEFEPGFVYNLEVQKTKLENPPADASSYNYSLERIVSRAVQACEFDSAIDDLDWLHFEIEKREAGADEQTKYCYITLAELNGNPVFLYNDCNPLINKVIPVYDCLGSYLGYLGGSIDFGDLKNQQIIWQPEDFACQFP